MKEAIQKAIDGGFKPKFSTWKWTPDSDIPDDWMFLDPLFWQALGKSLGWGNNFGFIQTSDSGEIDSWLESDSAGTVYQWEFQWHMFISHLANHHSAEDFFKELLSNTQK